MSDRKFNILTQSIWFAVLISFVLSMKIYGNCPLTVIIGIVWALYTVILLAINEDIH